MQNQLRQCSLMETVSTQYQCPENIVTNTTTNRAIEASGHMCGSD